MNLDLSNQEKSPKTLDLLNGLRTANGEIYNIFHDMAHSPLPIKAYLQLQTLVFREATLTKEEINLVQLAVSVANRCIFCVPAHTASALKTYKTNLATVDAIRNEEPIADKKVQALIQMAKEMVKQRGHLSNSTKDDFFKNGYTAEQLFEALTIVAYKTITNYTSAISGTQPNQEFSEFSWEPKEI